MMPGARREPRALPCPPRFPTHRRERLAVWPLRPGRAHGDPHAVVAVPGHLRQAEPPVKSLSALVDGEHVEDKVLAALPGLVEQRPDEAGAPTAALVMPRGVCAGHAEF